MTKKHVDLATRAPELDISMIYSGLAGFTVPLVAGAITNGHDIKNVFCTAALTALSAGGAFLTSKGIKRDLTPDLMNIPTFQKTEISELIAGAKAALTAVKSNAVGAGGAFGIAYVAISDISPEVMAIKSEGVAAAIFAGVGCLYVKSVLDHSRRFQAARDRIAATAVGPSP